MFKYIKNSLKEVAPQGMGASIAVAGQIGMHQIIESARNNAGEGADLDTAKTINGVVSMNLAASIAAWAVVQDKIRYNASNSGAAKVWYGTSMAINTSICFASSIGSLVNINSEYLGLNNISGWLAPTLTAATTITQAASSMFSVASSASTENQENQENQAQYKLMNENDDVINEEVTTGEQFKL